MPSDAFMEIQDPDTWGETYDKRYGYDDAAASRMKGGFEIFSFEFGEVPDNTEDDDLEKQLNAAEKARRDGKPVPKIRKKKRKGGKDEHQYPLFTIKKRIDESSADIYRLFCWGKCKGDSKTSKAKDFQKKSLIEWAVITIRRTGTLPDATGKRQPWLVLEFTDLRVKEFSWDLNPGASGDDLNEQETVKFEFKTINYKYYEQEMTGEHFMAREFQWDFEDVGAKVDDEIQEIG